MVRNPLQSIDWDIFFDSNHLIFLLIFFWGSLDFIIFGLIWSFEFISIFIENRCFVDVCFAIDFLLCWKRNGIDFEVGYDGNHDLVSFPKTRLLTDHYPRDHVLLPVHSFDSLYWYYCGFDFCSDLDSDPGSDSGFHFDYDLVHVLVPWTALSRWRFPWISLIEMNQRQSKSEWVDELNRL